MRVYGYEVRPDDWLEREDDDDDERGPLQLREATLFCTENDLRRVHRFISEVLTEADENELFQLEDWHEHFRGSRPRVDQGRRRPHHRFRPDAEASRLTTLPPTSSRISRTCRTIFAVKNDAGRRADSWFDRIPQATRRSYAVR